MAQNEAMNGVGIISNSAVPWRNTTNTESTDSTSASRFAIHYDKFDPHQFCAETPIGPPAPSTVGSEHNSYFGPVKYERARELNQLIRRGEETRGGDKDSPSDAGDSDGLYHSDPDFDRIM